MSTIDPNIRIGTPGSDVGPLQKSGAGKPGEAGVPFKDMLKGMVDQVSSLQKEADASIEGLITGQDTNVHNVIVKMEEAGVAFELMMKVREKLLDAYQQVMRMQS
jgi:flagellar hook-basal body complex protein FliE